jgi:hypothetical protein
VDYLFIPGDGRAERLGRAVLSRLPNTILITPTTGRNHVAGLLARLGELPPRPANPNPRPIGDLLLVAHGNETGQYFIRLARRLGSPADFEKADDANTANAVRLTAPLLEPAGGGPLNRITVRLRGCNIGRARLFIERLRDAMSPVGGLLNMTAPLHFDELHGIAGGTVEYLAHKFTLRMNQRFARQNGVSARDQLLDAFRQENDFAYLDGTDIDDADWALWVPVDIHPPRPRRHRPFDISVDLDPPANGQTTVTIHGEYRYDPITFGPWEAPPQVPANHQRTRGRESRQPTADERQFLKDTLPQFEFGGRHLYDPAYEWPDYERYGFRDLDDYVDNLDWRVTFNGRTLRFRAVRHEYTVMLPITDPPARPPPPAPPTLPVLRFYDFLPSRAAAGPAILHLDETNNDLYLSV